MWGLALPLLLASGGAVADDLLVSVTGQGVVIGISDWEFAPNPTIECDASSLDLCGASVFEVDEVITLTANPSPGYELVAWGGACAGIAGNTDCVIPLTVNGSSVFQVNADFTLIDTDSDGIPDGTDQCPGTAPGAAVDNNGCSQDQLDADSDGVSNNIDQCPNTPPGAAVDGRGCADTQVDDDIDGVNNAVDECPDTPRGESVDGVGCSATQLDDDEDGVANDVDQCPSTPAGATVDADGCADSELDGDEDGVSNDVDQCPSSPAGSVVDEFGCAASELDGDEDGVANDVDQCPNTAAGAEVDENGCSAEQLDSDGDGVSDALDQCPNTPPDSAVDSDGCSDGELDSDGDGVTDDLDACPNTDPDLPTDAEGCSEVQQFGSDLADLPGLTPSQRSIGARLDELCPRLVGADQGSLTPGQRELREACIRLKNRGTTPEEAAEALDQISLKELNSLRNYAIDIATSQYRGLGRRIQQVNSGGGRGVSVSGLNIRTDEGVLPAQALQSALGELLGLGASEDSFADFGNLGLFIQGDMDFGDKDQTEFTTGYDFDAWNLSLGGDYRFTDTFYAGAALAFGSVDVDYARKEGESQIDNWSVSVYAGWQPAENWFIDGLLSYGASDYETERRIIYSDIGGEFDSTQVGDTDGDQLFMGFNTGYMFTSGGWRLGPIVSLAYLDGSIDGFTERAKGASSAAWNFDVSKQDFESLRLSVGAQVDYAISTGFGVLIPGLRVAWVHETEDGGDRVIMRLVNDPFAGSDAQASDIFVTADERDSGFLDTSFNLSAQFVMGISGYFSYQFYSGYEDYSQDGFTIGLRWDKSF